MIKFRYADALVIGITQENVDKLLADNPLRVDLADLGNWPTPPQSVIVVYKPTLRECLEEFVGAGLLPATVLEDWRDPQSGETRRKRLR